MEEEKIEEVSEEAVTEESVESEIPLLEPTGNVHWVFQPSEYELKDYRSSWKKCHCGRQTWFNDNYCPACGQRLGKPENYYD